MFHRWWAHKNEVCKAQPAQTPPRQNTLARRNPPADNSRMTPGSWIISGAKKRLKSTRALTPADFHAIAAKLGCDPVAARKVGFIAATKASRSKTVETRWNGKETTNKARPGDWIVTSLSAKREVLRDGDGHVNTYVVAADRFKDLYQPTRTKPLAKLGAVYRAKSVVSALWLPAGFDIIAPWGERQTGPAGYLILNGTDVYGNNAETFDATYEQVKS
jgi:hypothetical protein